LVSQPAEEGTNHWADAAAIRELECPGRSHWWA
jgi:hypothetical protein